MTIEDNISEILVDVNYLLRCESRITKIIIIDITLELMSTVNKFKHLKGKDKKYIILQALNKNDFSKEIQLFINEEIPMLIDIFVAIDNRDLVIRNKSHHRFCNII